MKTPVRSVLKMIPLLFLLTGCSFGFMTAEITSELAPTVFIKGMVGSGNGSQSLSAAGCTTVTLHNVNSIGHKTTVAASAPISSTGNYQMSSSGLDMTSGRYLLEVLCTSSLYQRFLTGVEHQNLNYGSTLVSWFVHTANAPQIAQVNLGQLQSLYTQVEASASLNNAYTLVSSSLQSAYEGTTQTLVADLPEAAPQVLRVQTPINYAEEAAASVSAQAYHWSSSYVVFTEWQMNSVSAHTGASWNFTPTKNHQGARILNLLIGQEDTGAVDLTKPHASQNIPITITNNYPAVVPGLTYSGDPYTNQTALSFDLNTGTLTNGVYSHCETFTSLAVTEDAYSMIDIPPMNPAVYSVLCGPSPQTLNYTLGGTEGRRHIKVWARDSAGNISATPQKFDVTYDITNPVITITSPMSGTTLGRNTQVTLSWSLTEANPDSYTLVWAPNGQDPDMVGTPVSCTTALTASSVSCTWTVPNQALTDATLRLSMEDRAGNTGYADLIFSAATAPDAPVLTLDAAQVTPTNSRSVDLDVTYPVDATDIYYSTSSSTPMASAMGWEVLATDKTFTLPDTDGNYTIYAWVKNAIAVSSPDSVQVTLDRTAPVVSSVDIESGATNTSNNYVSVRMQGTDLSGITHYCALPSTQVPASAPDATSCVWMSVASTNTLDISPTIYLGDSAGLYYVYVWLRDGLNQVSTRMHDSIQYTPPAPATLSNGLASTSLGSMYPPALDTLFFDNPSQIYIKWSFAPASGVPAGNYTISIEHSNDGITFTPVNLASDVSDCSASVSAPFTHCYATNSPQTAGYHQYRIIAQAGLLRTSLLTPPLNLSTSLNYRFRILAGNTTLHTGEYALTSPVAPTPENHSKSIAMDSHGNIYLFDFNQGIMKFDPGTGVLERIVKLSSMDILGSPWGYQASLYDGPLNDANTVVSQRTEIAIDRDDNLIIWDNFHIRKIDFATNTLTTIIGRDDGFGSLTGAPQTNIPARDYGVNYVAYGGNDGFNARSISNLIPLPNGDILFRGRGNQNENSGVYAVYRHATQRVDEFQISGSFVSGSDNPTTPHNQTRVMHSFIKIDPASSEITQMFSYLICPNGGPCNQDSLATVINANWATNTWTTGASLPITVGNWPVYVENPFDTSIYRYLREGLEIWDNNTTAWTRLAGSGTVGFCDDSTPALNCNMDIRDVYVTSFNQILIWDGTRIRRLNSNNTLTTLIGTSVSTGDNDSALNAKLATIRTLDTVTNGAQTKVAFYESDSFKLREIRFDNNDAPHLYHIAGDGRMNGIPNNTLGAPALSSPLDITRLYYMPSSQNIFAAMHGSAGNNGVFQLNRSNWEWTRSFLGGWITPDDLGVGDGEPGLNISYFDHQFLFLDNTRALASNFYWYDSPRGACGGPECSFGGLKLFDGSDAWRQYNVSQGLGGQRNSPVGLVANQFFSNYRVRGPFSWESIENEFIMLFEGNNDTLYRYKMPLSPIGNDYAAAHATGNFDTYALDHYAAGFATYRRGGPPGDLMVVYCDMSGGIWRKDLTAGTAATQLVPNTTNFRCAGDTIRYNQARDSVVFAFTQNGVYGIAEIDLSP